MAANSLFQVRAEDNVKLVYRDGQSFVGNGLLSRCYDGQYLLRLLSL
ncbi:MAG: hypothetical protein ACLR76_09345 [Alistipes sp.]